MNTDIDNEQVTWKVLFATVLTDMKVLRAKNEFVLAVRLGRIFPPTQTPHMDKPYVLIKDTATTLRVHVLVYLDSKEKRVRECLVRTIATYVFFFNTLKSLR